MKSLHWMAFLAVSCVAPATERAQTDLDWNGLADGLTQRMQLQAGERVLLLGRPGEFDNLVQPLRAAVVSAGGIDLGALSVTAQPLPGVETDFVRQAATMDREALKSLFGDVDIAVMLPGATTTDPAYAAMQDVLRDGTSRTIHFHWAGAYDFEGNLLPLSDAINATYQSVLLETDYAALGAAQQAFDMAARNGAIRVTTPLGTDISFRLGDRPMTRQDGDASAGRASRARNLIDREIELPAGAIRVAPLESTVEGVIAFPTSTWGGRVVQGLTMRFERGRVVEILAEGGVDAVEAELTNAGAAGRSFRELALGFNPLLAVPDSGDWIPYYGYGAGVVRLSLGDNSELGGTVTGGYVRWNFFTDMTGLLTSQGVNSKLAQSANMRRLFIAFEPYSASQSYLRS